MNIAEERSFRERAEHLCQNDSSQLAIRGALQAKGVFPSGTAE